MLFKFMIARFKKYFRSRHFSEFDLKLSEQLDKDVVDVYITKYESTGMKNIVINFKDNTQASITLYGDNFKHVLSGSFSGTHYHVRRMSRKTILKFTNTIKSCKSVKQLSIP